MGDSAKRKGAHVVTRWLSDHIAVILAAIVATMGGVAYWRLDTLQAQTAATLAEHGVALQSEMLQELRSLYTAEVVERVRGHGIEVTHDYRQKERAIPLPATLTIDLGKRIADLGTGMTVRLYSDYPFSRRQDGGPRDDFERDALVALRDNPNTAFVRFENHEGRPVVRYAVADRMRAQCVSCHNTHDLSPRKDWKVGDVRGVLEIIRPISPAAAKAREDLRDAFTALGIIATLGFAVVALVSMKQRRDADELRKSALALDQANRELSTEIAEREQAQQALRAAHDQLEQRVAERTGELQTSNEHLEQEVAERKRAETILAHRSTELARSNTELEQMAYVASHDLQEPLRMVSSYLQLLEKRYATKMDADAHEFIGYAVDGAKHMQALINDLLAYSRVGTKVKPLKPVDFGAVVKTATGNLRLAIEESGAQVTCGPLPTLPGDTTLLVQLFQNLIGNAIKFRGPEPPRIHIEAEPQEAFWRFSVQDNGIGIAPEYFERIFALFQRLHSRREIPGTGMGLTICKRIVERHGGRIWVESAPEKGSIFRFTIAEDEGGEP